MKIEKPCFDFGYCVFRICECCTEAVCGRTWNTCEFGQLHPFYANWLKMTEQAAAGPWNYNLDQALEGDLLMIICCDGLLHLSIRKDGKFGALGSMGYYKNVRAFATINLPGGEK